ncbi:MAG: polysaccharide biosynthesis tyrosine autokinase [Myxococcota bacterium]
MEEAPQESPATGLQLRDLVAIAQMQWRVVAGCTVAALVLALLHGLLATSMYRSTAVIHLSPMAGQELKLERVVDADQYNRWNRQMFVQTQLEIIRSRKLLDEALQRYADLGFTDLAPGTRGVNALSEMLEVTPRQGTELIDLSITSDNLDKSARLANLISQTYERYNLVAQQQDAKHAKDWLQQQITLYRDRIDEATRKLIAYQGANDLADVTEQVTSLGARMDSLNAAYAESKTQRVLLETEVWAHERMAREGQYPELAKELDSPLITTLLTDYATAVTRASQLVANYGEKWPERVQAEAHLARIQTELQAEVDVTLKAERERLRQLRNKEANLEGELDLGKGEILDVSGKREDFQKLQIDLERAKEFYKRLNERNDELDLVSQTKMNNVRIVDWALPNPRRVEPNLILDLLIALVAGLAGGMILGFAREYVDDTISSPLDVQTFLKVPHLGMIPKITETADETELALFGNLHPRSSVAEALREIRTVLELDRQGPPRRLLVTSAVSSEGKTSTVVRLGVAFAGLDKRVLMIDGDLRRPRLHKIFALDRKVGLASVLTGTPVADVVRATPVPNLFVMASGRAEHPNELLASNAFPELLERLEQDYDVVIIDSPPSVLLSDARILSRHVDGVIVVVREQTTSRVLVREGLVGLEQIGARILGVIVNNVDVTKRRTSYKYAYGYGYGYRYRYHDGYYGDPADDAEEPSPAT